MSIELNKESVEQADASSCQGTNCGTTTGDHSSECLAEAAAGQGWELKPGDLCGRDCPIHKISVEQAGRDERAKFEYWASDEGIYPKAVERSGNCYKLAQTQSYWMAWQARAALAQPYPKSGDYSDQSWINAGCPPEQPEQAEAEQPEVVAWQYRVTAGPQTGWSLWHPGKGEEFERSYTVERRPLMTVAQHERIVGALRADRDSWAEQAEQRLADWDEMRKERDAALARVAELEACGAPALLAAADYFAERAKGPSPGWVTLSAVAKELRVRADKAPVAQAQQLKDLDKQCRDDVARALGLRPNQERGFAWSYLLASIKSCVKASEDSAQAQHSVPEGWMLVECGIWTQEQVDEMQKTVTRFRNSEFVDDRALAMAVADAGQCKAPEISMAELLAAAPGKEVGHE
ncbi:hypothetical protein I5F64_24840 [Pseudomonas aeruginosa]|nr:hypothetical protein [Pseudomonas aeruginosa]